MTTETPPVSQEDTIEIEAYKSWRMSRAIEAARGFLGIDQTYLAEKAGLSRPTINRIENQGRVRYDSIKRTIKALESYGIFIAIQGRDVIILCKT